MRRHLLTIMERSPLVAIIAHARLSSACLREGGFKDPTFHSLLVSDPRRKPGKLLSSTAARATSSRGSTAGVDRQSPVRGSGGFEKNKQPKTADPKEGRKKRQRFLISVHHRTLPECTGIRLRCAGSEESPENWPSFSSFQSQIPLSLSLPRRAAAPPKDAFQAAQTKVHEN